MDYFFVKETTGKIDLENCQHCGGEMKIIAAIVKVDIIEKILKHVGLSYEPPDIAPNRYAIQQPLF